MTSAEILADYHDTIAELSALCPARLPDVFGGIDGWFIAEFKETKENDPLEPDMKEHLSEALDRWGDRKFRI